jgi:all-trans-retinol 13,14-reductase
VSNTSPPLTRRVDAAPLVFGNAAPHALAEMLEGDEARTAFMAPYMSRPVSLSLWTIAFGFDRKPSELGVSHYSNPVFPASVRTLRDVAKGTPLPGASVDGGVAHYIFVDYTAVDTGLAHEPPYLGTAVGLDRVENWDGLSGAEYDLRRERWMDLVVQSLEQEFPGLTGAIVQRSMTTAKGAASYLGTPGGAMYGFAPLPRGRVLSTQTSIAGLWLSSAYAGLGGYSGAMIGAGSAVKSALGETWRDWGGV